MTRILIVDDKEENRYYLRTVLEGAGLQVETASHGAEALVKARRDPPGVVVSDLLMPVMDGYTLLRYWKADERLKRIPFIVYTATYTEEEDEALALDLGADAFILKPAEPDDFLVRIREVQERMKTSAPAMPKPLVDDERSSQISYTETLVRKLEEKTLQLEEVNRELQRDNVARRNIEFALRESEARLATATAAGRIGIWNWNLVTGDLVWSRIHDELWGMKPGTFGGSYQEFLAGVHPDDREGVDQLLKRAIATRSEYVHEHRVVWPNGSIHWIFAHGATHYDAEGRPLQMSGVVVDITQTKQAEEKNRRLSRLYAVSSSINEAIVRLKDTQDLYQRACRIAVEHGGLVMAWVGVADPNGEFLLPAARWGRDEGYLDILKVSTSADRWEGCGPAGCAFRTVTPAFSNDIATDSSFNILRSEALQRGFRSCAAFPLTSHGKATGVLVVYGDQTGYFETEELQVLNALAENISFAVEAHQQESQRLNAEEALRASEGRYRALFEHAPDGILIADAKSVYLDANPSALKMLGYDREEFLGLKAANIVAETNLPQVQPTLDIVKSGGRHHQEWTLQRKDASLFEADVLGTQMPDGNILAMIRDITERKRAEARFRRLVDSNAQAVVFWNTKREVIHANDAFLRLVGYTREDLEAGRIHGRVITPPEYFEREEQAIAEAKAHGVYTPFEKEYVRKDGSRVPVLAGGAIFEDNPDEGFTFVLDLSERKRLEQQFLRSQRMDSIGTLAGGIAHDLNNVLGPIILSLDLLKTQAKDPMSQELIGLIAASAQRGADMVRQVLSFACGVGGQRLALKLNRIISDIQKIANDTFLKNIEVQTIVPDHLWTVLGDPTQLHQVLLNLCVNARDSMPNGGKLTISVENLTVDSHYAGLTRDATPGPYVLLKVQDTGTGIDPAIVEKIFDPFFTTKEVGKGTGLGLATTLGIIKSHGGFIQVESAPGKGTSFHVYLPAHAGKQEEGQADPEASLPQGNGELILVVDDETVVREITKETLSVNGYKVVLAADGTEAVAAFASRGAEFSAVITDLMMPVMDGRSTISVLQRMSAEIPIIATSGLNTKAHTADLQEMGVKHFLPKPYSASMLLHTLSEVLAKQS